MRLSAIILCLGLSACVGTKIAGRDADTSISHPDLHSVPDKPKPVDFTAVEAERTDFDTSHEAQMRRNEELRKKFVAPVKKLPI